MTIEMFHNIYKGKTVLVTGHTGFKGSWLAVWLKELGAKVIGFALDPLTGQDTFVRTNLGEIIVDIRGNINNLNEVQEAFDLYKPDFVFHLAAQPIVRASYDNPIETFTTNAIGTAHILEVIRKTSSVQVAVFITTDKVYQNSNSFWGFRECDPLGGHEPYSASKACAEIIIDSYRRSFFMSKLGKNKPRIASARAGNVLGGGDWQNDRIVPDSIKALMNNKLIHLRNPNSVRPWEHVLDALGGYLLLGEKLFSSRSQNDKDEFTEAWNFGPVNDSITKVKDLVEKIIKSWQSGGWESEDYASEVKPESNYLVLDITKSIFKLGWHPVLTLDECVDFTVNWYKEESKDLTKNMYDLSISQILRFKELAIKKNISWVST